MNNQQKIEDFYKDFWRSESHISREPNRDERWRFDAILRLMKKYVLASFRNKENLRILDVGCGRGWLTNILSDYGNVIGVDPVSSAINRAHELFPDLDIRLTDAAGLLDDEKEKFQCIVSSEVIEHVLDEHKKDFLKSMHSLLVSGGFVILTTPRGELREAWKRTYPNFDQPIEQWITEEKLNQLCRSIGFIIVDRDRVFIPSFRHDWKSRIATSKTLRVLQSRINSFSKLLAKAQYHCALYQIIILKRL